MVYAITSKKQNILMDLSIQYYYCILLPKQVRHSCDVGSSNFTWSETFHPLLFDFVTHFSVSYGQIYTYGHFPILYFQPNLSQSTSQHFQFTFYLLTRSLDILFLLLSGLRMGCHWSPEVICSSCCCCTAQSIYLGEWFLSRFRLEASSFTWKTKGVSCFGFKDKFWANSLFESQSNLTKDY